jgi:hypothetical protein
VSQLGRVVLLVVVMALAGTALFTVAGRVDLGSQPMPPAGQASAPPSFLARLFGRDEVRAVPASDIIAAFREDKESARQLYGAEPIRVSGVVLSVSRDTRNGERINIGDASDVTGASIRLADGAADAARGLRPGQPVSFICSGLGELLGVPQLLDCRPAPPGDSRH